MNAIHFNSRENKPSCFFLQSTVGLRTFLRASVSSVALFFCMASVDSVAFCHITGLVSVKICHFRVSRYRTSNTFEGFIEKICYPVEERETA